MKNKCPICEGTGKLDDAQAWDCGQEPSDCPYCYTYQRGLSEGRKAGMREAKEIAREHYEHEDGYEDVYTNEVVKDIMDDIEAAIEERK